MRKPGMTAACWGRGLALAVGCVAASASADPLKEARFTQVVNRVEVLTPSQGVSAAAVGGIFRSPNSVRTGPAARAELQAADNTLTRVGANTLFRWGEEPRTIFLDQGNVLFYSPSGKGGGTIKTAGASAGVLGSTFIVSATRNGGFKVLALQHRTRVNINGRTRVLSPGQLTFILPGMRGAPSVFEFRLANQVRGSELVQGFRNPLPSLPAIDANIARQEREIASGKKKATDYAIGEMGEEGVELFDSNARQAYFDQVTAQEEIVDPLNLALQSDLFITTSLVDDSFVFFVDQQDLEDQINAFAELNGIVAENDDFTSFSSATLILARNIFIQTPSVDLGTMGNPGAIFFISPGMISFDQVNVDFFGYNGSLAFLANEIVFATGSGSSSSSSTEGIRFDGEFLGFFSIEGMTLDGNTISNDGGDLELSSLNGALTINNSFLHAAGEVDLSADSMLVSINDSSIYGVGGVFIDAPDIEISNSGISSDNFVDIFSTNSFFIDDFVIAAPSINIYAGAGDFNMFGPSAIVADIVNFRAPNGTMLIAGPGSSNPSQPHLQFLAMGSSFMQINLEARTIILDHVAFPFGSTIFLDVQNNSASFPLTRAQAVPGNANFVQNSVLYNGTPVGPPDVHTPNGTGGSGGPGSPFQVR